MDQKGKIREHPNSSLLIGFDSGGSGSVPALSIYKYHGAGNPYELVKTIDGDAATELYLRLTSKEG